MEGQVNACKPPSIALEFDAPKQERLYTADDLEQESQALHSEYTQVQAIFAKLEAVRQSLSPTLSH